MGQRSRILQMGMGGRVMRKPGGRGWHGVRAADDSEILRLKDISLEC